MSPETVALWHFDEKEDYMRPADVLGNVDLLVPAVTNRPAIVAATFGLARQCAAASSRAFKADCLTVAAQRALKLTRSFTVDAVITFNADPSATETLVARGLTGSAAERQIFAVQFIRSSGTMRFRWEDKGGTHRTADVTGIVFPSGVLYVAFVREWVAADDCQCRAYINGQLVGVVDSATADIEDGDTGEVTVGCRYNGAAYAEFLNGEIDELRIAQGARTGEEIEHTFRTLFTYPAWGYELIRQSGPPGTSDPDNPESKVLRTQMIEGDAMGLAWSKLAELIDYYHPDVAWSVLDHWERITRLAPLPTDSVATRRARVVAHLRKIAGFHRQGIADAVWEPMGFDTPEDVVIVESSNMWVDSLATVAARWTQRPSVGTITAGGGDTTLELQIGDDGRWTEHLDKAVQLEASVAEGARMEAIVALATTLDPSSSAGLFVRNIIHAEAHLFGIINDAGTQKFFHRIIRAGVSVTSTIGAAVPAGTRTYLRMLLQGDGLFRFQYRTDGSGYEGPWTDAFTAVATIGEKHYAGLFLAGGSSSSTITEQGDFRDWRLWCPESRVVYNWYVYADPILIPDPDITGAQVVIDRMKPAHTNGKAVQSLALVCDNQYSLTNRTPLGV